MIFSDDLIQTQPSAGNMEAQKSSRSSGMALSLFHFNVFYIVGSVNAAERYCEQAVLPFLEHLKKNPKLKITFEMDGSGLEFLSRKFPSSVALLRTLIEQGQVELLSSTYTPSFWPAFPLRDLEVSIRINKQVLRSLALPALEIFFSQEAFFGPGLKVIADSFPAVLCKDDYLRYMWGALIPLAPAYRMNGVLVLVGANHLANELAQRVRKIRSMEELPASFQKRIAKGYASIPSSDPGIVCGRDETQSWYWYHVGSGHHFTNWARPTNARNFSSDAEWIRLNMDVLADILSEDFIPAHLNEFRELMQMKDLMEMPPIIEGSWNSKNSSGVRAWMGRHTKPWQNDAHVLGLTWRARRELMKSEEMVVQQEDLSTVNGRDSLLEEMWKTQLCAEGSGQLGWSPAAGEVQYGIDQANKVLALAGSFRDGTVLPLCDGYALMEQMKFTIEGAGLLEDPYSLVEAIGEKTTVNWQKGAANSWICEVEFSGSDGAAGVRFKRDQGTVAYSPSGLEENVAIIDLDDFAPDEIFLPLANGFISLSESIQLIRINDFGQVAARVSAADNWVSFTMEGVRDSHLQRWQFILLSVDRACAMRLANRIHRI